MPSPEAASVGVGVGGGGSGGVGGGTDDSLASSGPSGASVRAVLGRGETRTLLVAGLFFFLAFMWMQFLSAWIVQHISDSARLVQLTGFCQMAPNILGPPLGLLADRVDKRKLEAGCLLVMMLVSAGMALAVALDWPADLMGPTVVGADGADTPPDQGKWLAMIYAHQVVVGFGIPIFSVCHMPQISLAAGKAGAQTALAMAACCFGIGGIVGNVLGGVVVDLWRPTGAYIVGAVWWLISLVLLLTVRTPPARERDASVVEKKEADGMEGKADGVPEEDDTGVTAVTVGAEEEQEGLQAGGCRSLLQNRPYMGVLGITVLSNLFYWGHVPFIQVIADNLDTSATAAGVLGSSTSYGVLFGCVVCAARPPRRIGLAFAAGSCVASGLLAVAAIESYALAFVGLLAASCGAGFFGATQAALVMQAVPPAQHGLGMGVLALAIGAQAGGMILFGEVGEWLGPSATVLLMAGVGFGTQVLFNAVLPDCARMVDPGAQAPGTGRRP